MAEVVQQPLTTRRVVREAAAERAGQANLRRVAKGSTLNLVGAGITSFTNLALTLIVTRGFSQNVAGQFFSATSVFVLLVSIGRLGSGTGLVYFVSRFRALGVRDGIERCLRIALRPVIATAVVAAVAMFAFAGPIAALITRGDASTTTLFLREMALLLPFAAASEVFQAGTRGLGSMRTTVVVEKIGRPAVQLVLVAAAVLVGTHFLVVGWALPYAPAAVLAAYWMRQQRRKQEAKASGEESAPADLTRAYWRFTAPRAMSGLAQVALQRLDVILVGAMRGPAEAAVYAAATRFLTVGTLGNQAISFAVQPQVSGLLAKDDREATNHVYQTSTAWLVLITWPIYLLTAIFSATVLRLFGDDYSAGAAVMIVLAGSMLVATACGMVDVMLSMAGRTTWNLANVCIALAVNVGLDLILIPRYGILGAAIGWAVAIVANNLIPLAQVGFSLRLHPFGPGLLSACTVAAVSFGGVPLIVLGAGGDRLPTLLLGAGIGGVVYLGSLWLFRDTLHLETLGASLPAKVRKFLAPPRYGRHRAGR